MRADDVEHERLGSAIRERELRFERAELFGAARFEAIAGVVETGLAEGGGLREPALESRQSLVESGPALPRKLVHSPGMEPEHFEKNPGMPPIKLDLAIPLLGADAPQDEPRNTGFAALPQEILNGFGRNAGIRKVAVRIDPVHGTIYLTSNPFVHEDRP
jgi:hypothetical protein